MQELIPQKRFLTLFQLIMMAIISVDSLRNLPTGAQYGASLITFYLFAGLTFFLPLTWVASRLAIKYPNTGGSYLWIEAAFGKYFGYLSIWLQWIYNMIWYPTIFAFISGTLALLIHPGWEGSKWFIWWVSIGFFWFLTIIQCYGVRINSLISTIGAIVGTLFPMLLVMFIAGFWLISGKPSSTPLTWHALLPSRHAMDDIAFFSNILFSLLGLEVIAMHAGNVKNPKKTFPLAFNISALLIITTLILSSVALCIIIPSQKIALLSGLMDVFNVFFAAHPYFAHATTIVGWCIVIGGLGITSAWMIGLARGLHVALCSTNAPPALQRLNKNGIPKNVLILQAVVYSILLSAFLLMPNINSSYWILSALTAQFALLYYVLLFLAAIKLFLSLPQQTALTRVLSIGLPSIACIVSLFGIVVGFLPPDSIHPSSVIKYELLMLTSFIVLSLIPFFILRRWQSANANIKTNEVL